MLVVAWTLMKRKEKFNPSCSRGCTTEKANSKATQKANIDMT
jgi:hypothetical protein